MRHRFSILPGSAAVALAAATAALAGTLTATATVAGASGMSMSLPSNPSITDTLDGSDQVVSWSAPLGIADARGSGAGWNLTLSATPFADELGHTIAPGTITAVSAACQDGNTCTAATNTVAYPIAISGTAAKFFNALANTGLGKVDVTPSMDVAIPGNAYAGPYISTVTLAAVSGP
jgi:hypothetical protein